MTPNTVPPVLIFIRDDHFYPIGALPDRPLAEQAADHAKLNPGTRRVEDVRGNVLWSEPEQTEPTP